MTKSNFSFNEINFNSFYVFHVCITDFNDGSCNESCKFAICMIKIGYAVRRSVLLDISCINTGRTSKDGSCYAIIYTD